MLQSTLANLPPDRAEQLLRLVAARRRAAARSRLIPFCQHINPRYVADPFHLCLAEHLEAVLRGDIRRLMVFAPPQTGKSMLTSVFFPTFWLAHRTHEPIILSSYAAELAESKSRDAKMVIESDAFRELFPSIQSRQDSRAANRWHIQDAEGGMRATGVEGGISGHPAGLGIIDDPIKDMEWVFSETQLEKVWRWYEVVFSQRLWETAPVILIMTRWSDNDLAGRILRSKEAAHWTVLRFPALAETQEERDYNNARLGLPSGLADPLGREPGEALAPHRYSREYLESVRDGGSAYRWSALYMGVPRPPEGDRIKREWLKIVDAAPQQARRVRYWDKAGTEGGGARTAGVLAAKADDGLLYIEDVVFGQWDASKRNTIMHQVAQLDAARYVVRDPEHPEIPDNQLPNYNTVRIWVEQEPGSGGQESAQLTIKDLGGYAVSADKVTGSKDARLEPFITYAGAGNVRLVRGRWNEPYIEEMVSVGHGQFRDMADATAGAFNKLHLGGLVLGILGENEDDEGWK